jgi:hypothetical protein
LEPNAATVCQVVLASQATAVPSTGLERFQADTMDNISPPSPASFLAFADDDPARPGFGSR